MILYKIIERMEECVSLIHMFTKLTHKDTRGIDIPQTIDLSIAYTMCNVYNIM